MHAKKNILTLSLWALTTYAVTLLSPISAHGQPLPAALTAAPSVSAQSLAANDRALLEQAQQQLANGNAAQALTLLQQSEGQLAGHPEFDFLLGQSALHADEPSLAAFAFERCLAINPQHELCRLGILHAHVQLNETHSARTEIRQLRQSARTSEVQATIAHYLDLLSQAETDSLTPQLSSYIQVGVGYDTNINSATDLSEIALPGLDDATYLLPKEHQRQKSGFATARYHVRYVRPLDQKWSLTAQGTISARGNFDTGRYNHLVSTLQLGIDRSVNQHQFSTKIQLQNYRLRNRNFRNSGSILTQYAYSFNNTTELSVFGQATKINYSGNRYAPNNSRRNAKRFVGGLTLLKGLANERAVGYLTAYGGTHQKTKHMGPKNQNHRLAGVRIGGTYLVTPRFMIQAGVSIERRHFRHEHSSFGTRRKDTFYDVNLGAAYAINRKLSLRPQYQYYTNRSNIPLSRYKRHIFMLNLRYDLL